MAARRKARGASFNGNISEIKPSTFTFFVRNNRRAGSKRPQRDPIKRDFVDDHRRRIDAEAVDGGFHHHRATRLGHLDGLPQAIARSGGIHHPAILRLGNFRATRVSMPARGRNLEFFFVTAVLVNVRAVRLQYLADQQPQFSIAQHGDACAAPEFALDPGSRRQRPAVRQRRRARLEILARARDADCAREVSAVRGMRRDASRFRARCGRDNGGPSLARTSRNRRTPD